MSEPADPGAPAPGKQRVQERLATLLLLGVAVLAAVGFITASRGNEAPSTSERYRAQAPKSAASTGEAPAPSVARSRDASELLAEACSTAEANCDCSFKALDHAFSLSDSRVAEQLLAGIEKNKTCTELPRFLGYKAEVLARTQKAEAQAAIEEARSRRPDDAHAALAAGLSKLAAGDLQASAPLLDLAERLGRGPAAITMKGILALKQNDTAAARAAFERALAADPEDVEALWNLATLDSAKGAYNKPRSTLLKALRLRPDHLEARYALGKLTLRAGALPEARRHLSLLEASAPTGDPRVLQLRAQLEKTEKQAPNEGRSSLELHVQDKPAK